MTDIDFDELDKAVSNVLGPRSDKKAEESPAPEAAPAPENKPEAPKADTSATPSPTIQLKTRQTIASPAAKRSGRFMDVVHPSSDMATAAKSPTAARVKIVPTANAPKPEPAPEKKEEEKVAEPVAESTPVAPPEVAPEPALEGASAEPDFTPKYPDPLDVMEKTEDRTDNKPEGEAAEDVAVTPDVEEEVPAAAAPTSETPFIPDAKVEKRPLGGIAPEPKSEFEEPVAGPADEASSETADLQLPPEADLPPALQSDVVAVESDAINITNDVEPNEGAATDEPAQEDKSVEPEPAHEEEKPADDSAAAKPEERPADTNSGPAQSIPQQYRSEAATTDETPRPVFDTEQYHQPLIAAHSGQKHHTGLFLLLILALLLVGAGLGYFAFVSGF